MNAPEYQALRECVRNRDVAAITLRDMGRLGQDFDERMLFIINLRKAGIELHTVERGQRDRAAPYSMAVGGIQAATAELIRAPQHETSLFLTDAVVEQGIALLDAGGNDE